MLAKGMGAKNTSTAAKRPSKMRPSNALTARYVLPSQMSTELLQLILLETFVLVSGARQMLEGLLQISRCIGQDCPLKGNMYVQH
jgi:hypothetical protein